LVERSAFFDLFRELFEQAVALDAANDLLLVVEGEVARDGASQAAGGFLGLDERHGPSMYRGGFRRQSARSPATRGTRAAPASATSTGTHTSPYRPAPKNTACVASVVPTTAAASAASGRRVRAHPRRSACATSTMCASHARRTNSRGMASAARRRRARALAPGARARASSAASTTSRCTTASAIPSASFARAPNAAGLEVCR